MKRVVSQKTLAIRSPFLGAYSPVVKHSEYVGVVHQITDLCGARQRTARQRYFKLRTGQLAIDALPLAEKPDPRPLHLEGKWQSSDSVKLLALVADDAPPN